MSINRVNISGNLTRDPEMMMTQGGTSILRMGVAVNDRRKNNQTGEWEDKPNFVDCKLFGRRAQSLEHILHKGMKVAIEGHLDYSTWKDRQTGQNRSKLEVIVDEIEFMSPKQGQGQGGFQAANRGQQPAPRPAYQSPAPAPAYQKPAPQPTQQPLPAWQGQQPAAAPQTTQVPVRAYQPPQSPQARQAEPQPSTPPQEVQAKAIDPDAGVTYVYDDAIPF